MLPPEEEQSAEARADYASVNNRGMEIARRVEQCPHCELQVTHNNMGRHIKSKHKRPPNPAYGKFPCPYCDNEFKLDGYRRRHIERMHPQSYLAANPGLQLVESVADAMIEDHKEVQRKLRTSTGELFRRMDGKDYALLYDEDDNPWYAVRIR